MVADAPQMRPPWSLTTRIAARVVAAGFRLLSRSMRFRAAVIVARIFAAPIGWLLKDRPVETPTCGGPVDQSLRVVLRLLTWGGVTFDAPVSAGVVPGAAIFVSAHFPLNALFTRALYDRGIRPAVLKARPEMDTVVWGTGIVDDAVRPSPSTFVTFRRILAEERPVILDIDSGIPARRSVPLDAGHVSTSIFPFARRMNVPIFFFAVRADGFRSPIIVVREIDGVDEFLELVRGLRCDSAVTSSSRSPT